MTGFVKTEHRQSHNLPLPLSTLSRYLCISPHSSLSSRKSISRSFHSKVHYSLLPAAFSVCYLSHSHYLCLSLQLSSLSSLYWLKSDLMFFLRHFFLSLLPLVSILLTASSPRPGTFLAYLFLSLSRQTMQIFCILYYFTLTLLSPPATSNPILPLFLHRPPPSPCVSSLVLHALYHFWQRQLKKKRIYANARLKNECSPPLQCVEESSERLITIFSLCCGSAG